jgi:hypothetical protein
VAAGGQLADRLLVTCNVGSPCRLYHTAKGMSDDPIVPVSSCADYRNRNP